MRHRSSLRRSFGQGTFPSRGRLSAKQRKPGPRAILVISLVALAVACLVQMYGSWATSAAAQGSGGSCAAGFTVVDVTGAGTGMLQGGGGTGINANGDIVGTYVTTSGSVLNLAHGFVRVAATGTTTTFDAPNAGTNKNEGTFAVSINDSGVITGVSSDSITAEHGFVRAADGTMTEFDVPAAPTNVTHRGTSPTSINASGVITGMYETADTVRHGFVRATDGTITAFDVSAAGTGLTEGTIPLRINAGGDITGFYVDASHLSHAFIRAADGTITAPIDAPGAGTTGGGSGFGFGGTIAVGIDTAGDIAGIYADTNSVYHGYLRTAGGTIATFDVTGAGTTGLFPGTIPTSMNPGGDIAGFYADTTGINHAFLRNFTTTTITAPLDAPNASKSGMFNGTVPFGINASDALTGLYFDANVVLHGFVYGASASAAAPIFSPAPGTYPPTQSVTISDATTGASVYYTTDGSTPSPGSGTTQLYSGPIMVSSTETINAIASATGCANSSVATATYTIAPAAATPTFSPAAGTYTSAQTVTISDATTATTIYYTTNGATPTTASTVYNGPIAVGSTETIEAIAAATGFSNSAVASATYTLNLPTPDFQVSVAPTTLTIVAGQSGTATFTVTPENGFNSAVSFACSGLPSEATCAFNPTSVTPNGKAITSTLTVTTTAPSSALLSLPEFSQPFAYAALVPVLVLLLAFTVKRKATPSFKLASLLLLLAATCILASCNSGTKTVANPGTPAGNSTVSVSAATSGAGAITHGATLTITITE